MHSIRDLTADTAGGHNAVIQLQAGGGLFAQRLVTRKHYELAAAKQRALDRTGLAAAVPEHVLRDPAAGSTMM